MEHIAIQNKEYTFDSLPTLSILCRCKLRKDPPYDKVTPGDIVYILQDGLIKVKTTVLRVLSKEYDDISEIRNLCEGTSPSLYNGVNYWNAMRNRHYGTVVWLANNNPLAKPIRPKTRSYGHDWIVLDNQQKRQKWLG